MGWVWVDGLGWQDADPETSRLALPRAASGAAGVLGGHGILRPAEVVELAAKVGLDLAAAATLLEKESGGGRNVWGSDAVNTGGIYTKGAPVTREAYLAYKARRRELGCQGVGPTQLTYGPFQDQADQAGGCWDWRANTETGFRILADHIRRLGLRAGFRAYNGSGPAAERYADDAMTRYRIWQARLAGAQTAPEQEAPEMAVMPWTLPAGQQMEETIPIPLFPPYSDAKRATLWMVTGWQPSHIRAMYFIRDRGPNLSPQIEQWGGTGDWMLAPDDRPSFDLGVGCTSVAVMYDSPRDIQCLIVYPQV